MHCDEDHSFFAFYMRSCSSDSANIHIFDRSVIQEKAFISKDVWHCAAIREACNIVRKKSLFRFGVIYIFYIRIINEINFLILFV